MSSSLSAVPPCEYVRSRDDDSGASCETTEGGGHTETLSSKSLMLPFPFAPLPLAAALDERWLRLAVEEYEAR
jgi:hypothetical protein